MLLSLPSDEMQVYLEVTGLSISGAGITETKDILDRHFREIVEKGELVFESEGKQVKIPYTDFELQIDARSILEKIEKADTKTAIFS